MPPQSVRAATGGPDTPGHDDKGIPGHDEKRIPGHDDKGIPGNDEKRIPDRDDKKIPGRDDGGVESPGDFEQRRPPWQTGPMTSDPERLRLAYAHQVVARFGGRDQRVEAAFAKVPREAFLGPPPWLSVERGRHDLAKITDPAALYRDILIALDLVRGINNGQPSLHAACLESLGLTPNDRALHIGAGTGYYTAIMAELAGTVDAYEIEPDLAARAAENLVPWPNVTVHAESATGRPLPDADAIYVSAGATHPDQCWLDALRDGGRLLFPLTGDRGSGGMLKVERRGPGFAARFLLECGFIPCAGARDPVTAGRLRAVFEAGGRDRVRSLTRVPPPGASVWFAGNGWYLSTDPPPGDSPP